VTKEKCCEYRKYKYYQKQFQPYLKRLQKGETIYLLLQRAYKLIQTPVQLIGFRIINGKETDLAVDELVYELQVEILKDSYILVDRKEKLKQQQQSLF